MSKKFGVNQAKINSTCFAKCHLGQNRKRIIGGWSLNMAMKSFAIFEQDRAQTICENYLGILGCANDMHRKRCPTSLGSNGQR